MFVFVWRIKCERGFVQIQKQGADSRLAPFWTERAAAHKLNNLLGSFCYLYGSIQSGAVRECVKAFTTGNFCLGAQVNFASRLLSSMLADVH